MKLFIKVAATVVFAGMVAGCGTFTGLPSHGGGKRFAVEQELVSATARAAAKDVDVTALKGKAVAVYIVGMGDEGAGNLIGGRYSINGMLRGQHVETPRSDYPTVRTTTTSAGVVTVAENALNAPERTDGFGHDTEVGLSYRGLGAYQNADMYNPRDSQFLSAVIQESLALAGVRLVDPAQAEIDLYVTVDVFGTIRQRTDWHLVNNEVLKARTALQVTAIDRATGAILMPPAVSSFEAEYRERYVLWAGPYETTKELRRSEPLLADIAVSTPE